jgi:hypothetical protein
MLQLSGQKANNVYVNWPDFEPFVTTTRVPRISNQQKLMKVMQTGIAMAWALAQGSRFMTSCRKWQGSFNEIANAILPDAIARRRGHPVESVLRYQLQSKQLSMDNARTSAPAPRQKAICLVFLNQP